MIRLGRNALLLTTLTALSLSFSPPSKGRLTLAIKNIQKSEGTIWIGIYNSKESFLVKEQAILKEVKISTQQEQLVVIEELPFGKYAIALFHDVNANGELDRNFIGIPSEPYAFSKKPRSKFRLPKFEEIEFSFAYPDQYLQTKLQKWWD